MAETMPNPEQNQNGGEENNWDQVKEVPFAGKSEQSEKDEERGQLEAYNALAFDDDFRERVAAGQAQESKYVSESEKARKEFSKRYDMAKELNEAGREEDVAKAEAMAYAADEYERLASEELDRAEQAVNDGKMNDAEDAVLAAKRLRVFADSAAAMSGRRYENSKQIMDEINSLRNR